jgi:hypothetical protein
MRPSRGMGCINPKKMPGNKPRVIHRKDDPDKVDVYKQGGKVNFPGLYANIHAKRKRMAEGSGEKMRKPGSPGAPTFKAFKKSALTVKK